MTKSEQYLKERDELERKAKIHDKRYKRLLKAQDRLEFRMIGLKKRLGKWYSRSKDLENKVKEAEEKAASGDKKAKFMVYLYKFTLKTYKAIVFLLRKIWKELDVALTRLEKSQRAYKTLQNRFKSLSKKQRIALVKASNAASAAELNVLKPMREKLERLKGKPQYKEALKKYEAIAAKQQTSKNMLRKIDQEISKTKGILTQLDHTLDVVYIQGKNVLNRPEIRRKRKEVEALLKQLRQKKADILDNLKRYEKQAVKEVERIHE